MDDPRAARTVLGDVPADTLGRTDYHEHLFQVSPLLPGDELDDEQRSRDEAAALHSAGIDAIIDATPVGLGRDPAGLARISARTGLHVVAATGAHREEHYPAGHWLHELSVPQLVERFIADVTEGMPARDRPTPETAATGPAGKPVRAGILKAGAGYWSLTAFTKRVLAAVAEAHAQTGAPVMVHLEHGSAAFEVLNMLVGSAVPAEAVVLAHVDRNPDPGLHAELAAAGAYLGYDGPARSRSWPDSILLDCMVAAAGLGAAERLLLGGDVARRSRYTAYGGLPGMAYLPRRFIPRLEQRTDPAFVRQVLVTNPARLLGRRWITPPRE